MIKWLKLGATLAALLTIQSCAVIHFENGVATPDPVPEQSVDLTFGLFSDEDPADLEAQIYADQLGAEDSVRYSRWYHQAIFSIAEVSNPLQLNVECAGLEWNQITTEVTFWGAIIGLTDNALLFNASSAALDLWKPWSLEYSCRRAN